MAKKTAKAQTLSLNSDEPFRESPAPAGAKMPAFTLVKTKRVFEEICDQVRQELAAGTLGPGDKLPPERDLALKFGVSRSAVREALRSLEISGVVRLQKGVKGGAVILQGDADLVTRSFRDMFILGRISLDSLTEARTRVMQMAVELACERMTPELLATLEENNRRFKTAARPLPVPERVAFSIEFYQLLARAMQNEVLQAIVESLSEIVLHEVAKSDFSPMPDVIAHRQRLIGYLAQRDKEAAKQEIGAHLRRLHKHVIDEVARQEKNRQRS
jgi:GntR family transcriptional regulator, transcriptional repressor for pyruvate dehydrogenase complex